MGRKGKFPIFTLQKPLKLFQIIAFIKFLIHSTNQHGVHSPFIYNLLTRCLYKKDKKQGFNIIKSYRKALLRDMRVIEVKDFGAGSKVFKSNSRKVSRIAKNAGISKKRAFLLNRLTSYLKIKSALELGTSLGISSTAIAAGNPVKLITLEGCPETGRIAQEYFDRFGLNNVNLKIGSFEEILESFPAPKSPPAPEGRVHPSRPAGTPPKERKSPQTPEGGAKENISVLNHPPRPTGTPPKEGKLVQSTTANSRLTTGNQTPNPKPHSTDNPQLTTDNPTTHNSQTFDLIYFDGNHQKEATLKYFHELLPLSHNDSVFIFDDIHWSEGMEKAWEEIKAHPQVRVSIDSFFWGIVFFRKEQEKEHFILRL